jgi:hypothetical protein
MSGYDIILIIDVFVFILAGLLFLVSRFSGGAMANWLLLLAKIMVAAALITYVVTEMVIGKGANLAWGLLLIIVFVAVMYFVNRRNQDTS